MTDTGATLFSAGRRGDIDAVRQMLEDGTDPNWRDSGYYRHSLLHWASWHGSAEIVRLLLAHGASPNIEDAAGFTPLFLGLGYPDTVVALLLGGADVNARDHDGRMPLMEGASGGFTESVELLLDHGANPWLMDDRGWIALRECERRGDPAGTRAALEHAMNVTWRNNSPPTLEELAAFQLRRMRSQIDEEKFVDTIPDALVWFYFRDWEGAEKWTGLWRDE